MMVLSARLRKKNGNTRQEMKMFEDGVKQLEPEVGYVMKLWKKLSSKHKFKLPSQD